MNYEQSDDLDSNLKKIKEIAADTKEKAKLLQSVVEDNANPHPAKVAIIFALILATIWLLYIIFVKPNMSGIWIDTQGNKWVVHQTLGDMKVKVITNDRVIKGHGKLTDNIFKFKGYTGVWNYDDVVVFLGSSGGMERVKDK